MLATPSMSGECQEGLENLYTRAEGANLDYDSAIAYARCSQRPRACAMVNRMRICGIVRLLGHYDVCAQVQKLKREEREALHVLTIESS